VATRREKEKERKPPKHFRGHRENKKRKENLTPWTRTRNLQSAGFPVTLALRIG